MHLAGIGIPHIVKITKKCHKIVEDHGHLSLPNLVDAVQHSFPGEYFRAKHDACLNTEAAVKTLTQQLSYVVVINVTGAQLVGLGPTDPPLLRLQ